jgi:glycosyltransferase involved in cell wall biosynthesis
MTICHFIASKGLGRGEAYIELVNCLCETIDIALLVPEGALFLHRIHPNIQVYRYTSRDSRNNPALYFELYRLFKRFNPDVVHTHFAKASEIFSRLNLLLRLPHIATKHNPRKGKIFNKLKHVIAVSEAVAQSVTHENVTVIHNGIKREAVHGYKVNDVFKICAVGRLDKIKGFDLLISEVDKLDFDFHLMIVGEGDERNSLQQLINDMDLCEKVKLLGFRTDIPDLLASSDLQVMCSHSEGFSLAMIEAIYYSTVFVSTPVSGCMDILPPELLIDNFKIADKITEIHAKYTAHVEQFKIVKIKYADEMSVDACSGKHTDYYSSLDK